jgi:hypothetical protein
MVDASDYSACANVGLGVLCEAWRGVLQNFTINAVDILVIDFYALHIRTIDAFKSSFKKSEDSAF